MFANKQEGVFWGLFFLLFGGFVFLCVFCLEKKPKKVIFLQF